MPLLNEILLFLLKNLLVKKSCPTSKWGGFQSYMHMPNLLQIARRALAFSE